MRAFIEYVTDGDAGARRLPARAPLPSGLWDLAKHYRFTPTATDWIGLYAAGAPATSFVDWLYVNCTKSAGAARASGSCAVIIPTGLTPGAYELRLFGNNGYTTLAASGPVMVSTVVSGMR